MNTRDLKRLQEKRARLRREAEERRDEAASIDAEVRSAERALDRDQCILLGRAQKQDVAKSPRYAARVVVRLHEFLTRPRDRIRFGMEDDPSSSALDWISDNPEYQRRVREEVKSLLASQRSTETTPSRSSVQAGDGSASARAPLGKEAKPPESGRSTAPSQRAEAGTLARSAGTGP